MFRSTLLTTTHSATKTKDETHITKENKEEDKKWNNGRNTTRKQAEMKPNKQPQERITLNRNT
jgi:hypothetical protein